MLKLRKRIYQFTIVFLSASLISTGYYTYYQISVNRNLENSILDLKSINSKLTEIKKDLENDNSKSKLENQKLLKQREQLKQKIQDLEEHNLQLNEKTKKLEQELMTINVPISPPILSSRSNIEIINSKVTEDNLEFIGSFACSFYTISVEEGTSGGITASGAIATPGVTVAVDPNYWPLGTRFYIEGIGVVIAQDTGGAIKGSNRMDILVSSREQALSMGRQNLNVWVIH